MSTIVYAQYWCCDLCDFRVYLCEEVQMRDHMRTEHGIDCDAKEANSGMCGDIFIVSDLVVPKKEVAHSSPT